MMRIKSLAMVLAALLALVGFGAVGASAAPVAAAGGNLVGDPGFESGLGGWSCDAGTASVVGSPVHSGSAALAATPTSSDTAQCSQAVAVRPNSAYTLSAYVQGSYVYLGATGYSSTWTPSASGWQQLSTSFTTGAGVTSVTVYLHGWYGQPTYYADDVSLIGPGGGGGGSAPPTPTGLSVTATTTSSVSLAWTEPSGSTAAASYRVYEGSSVVASPTATSATISGLASGSTHTYTVTALASDGTESAASGAVTATTQGSGGGGSSWHPSYLAVGTVYTPGSTVDAFMTTLQSHGAMPNYGYEYLLGNDFSNWASTTTTLINHSTSFGMTPVLVDYGMNGNVDGTSVDFTNMQSSSWLTTYFQALKTAATTADTVAPGRPVGWIVEPDMMGYLQQNYAANYGGDAAQMPAATSAAYSAGVLGSGDPTFGDDLKGLVEAINYTIKKYDPTAFVGWQVNTWGVRDALKDTDTMGWTAGRQSVVNTATQVANFLATADLGYHADFVAFDQWGQDFGYLRDPNPAGDIRYLNAAHWSNYLLYVQTIRSSLNLPAVLWQIACGHLNSTQTPSPTYWNTSGSFPDLDDVTTEQYEDSASTFFFGDTFTSSGNNLAFYGSNPGADPKISVNGSTITWGSHMSDAASAGVVAILFGAGTGTGTYGVPEMVGTNQNTPSDFDYWVTRVQSYLAAPAALP
ncbi:carbohydrate binding domain-containing protein [Catenulispora sp. NF23]|uniref:Carbohydrate binding domain-containing protein n=1 Tax=Catenulispora pinistramenti TaxID=2705254 RepID=A0ABS5L2E7_9ACTN|nr:carbohydrate binding domain-containing protein [Catenulispora pinistramenti]MBS2535732.1 carbohydrate binding domain-containing protein [Catenulispora pinistramenti]MBS2552344.1 carbohydrate binding domain-containing protein [Catenulispora pinistramenti]